MMMALLVLCVPTFAFGQTADEKKATIAYIQSLQIDSGAFLSMQPKPNIRLAPSLRATSAAIRALKYWGAEIPNVEAVKKYVASCFDAESGGFGERPGNPAELFVTATGLMAAAELKMPLDIYREKTVAYFVKEVKTFEDMRIAVAGLEAIGERGKLLGDETATKWVMLSPQIRKDGAFIREARTVGGTVAAQYRLGFVLPSPVREKEVLTALSEDQRPDGGFGFPDKETSDLETTYRVMRTFARLKGSPKSIDKVRAFLAKCRNADGGYGVAPGEGSTGPATYYAGIILYWLDGASKK